MNFSNVVQKMITDWLRGSPTTPPVSLTIALSTANPQMNGSGIAEPPSPNGYVRQAFSFGPEAFVNGTGTTIKSSTPIVFGPCTNSDWGTITHIAIYSASGSLLLQGQLAAPRLIAVGDTYSTSIDAIQLLLH